MWAFRFMIMRAAVTIVLILALVPLFLWSPSVIGQASSTTTSNGILVANFVSVKPRIDGVWLTGEWNDANEYRLTSAGHDVNGKGEAYVRVQYDGSSLYGLVDVRSDDGSILPGNQSGLLYLAMDLNMNGLLGAPQPDRFTDVDVLVNTYYNVTTNVSEWFCPKPPWFSEINATQRLGISPHSSKLRPS